LADYAIASTIRATALRLTNVARRHRFILLLLVEAAYWLLTRVVVSHYRSAPVLSESLRTGLRLASFCCDCWLYWPVLSSRLSTRRALRSPVLGVGVALFMAVPVVMLRPQVSSPITAIVFGLASIVVALKEEVLFRGIFQNLLQTRRGPWFAIAVTTAVFTIWHVGVVHPLPWVAGQIIIASLILGLVYAYTGSLLAVVGIHACYDALWYVPSLVPRPISPTWAFVLLVMALGMVAAWAWPRAGHAGRAPGVPADVASIKRSTR
jgi:membrane protease YdiL (CAAX protease family)